MLTFYETESKKALRGRFLNPISDLECQHHHDGLLLAEKRNGTWRIAAFGPSAAVAAQANLPFSEIPYNEGLILPPFFDLHFHWVQDDVRADPKVSLIEWLERYAFPEEARFADPDYAELKAKAFWNRIYSVGTVGGLCYGSTHREALDAAMRHAPNGFHIGGVLMTMNCPALLRQTVSEAIAAVAYGTETYGSRYCVSPRFAPTTHPDVMKEAASCARKHGLFQQTHLDETPEEIKWTLGIYQEFEAFRDVSTYTEIYQRCGMLGPKTVMGHAIHLTEEECDMLAASDTAIASCPSSNAPYEELGLGSGLFDFRRVEEAGIRWALASDIGGGPYLSMLDVMDSFVRQNKKAEIHSATYTKALYRATVASAEILQVGDHEGNFAPGKAFNCIQLPCPPDAQGESADVLIPAILSLVANREARASLVAATVVDGDVVFAREESLSEKNP